MWLEFPEDKAFDRTYEGLKHLDLEGKEWSAPPFDRTYEGLKQEETFAWVLETNGF